MCKRINTELNKNDPFVVATEYPNITNEYLGAHFKHFEILPVKGATEAYPHLDGVNAIVDIVETGKTIKGNSLELVDEVFMTYPCMVHRLFLEVPEKHLEITHLAQIIADTIASNQIPK